MGRKRSAGDGEAGSDADGPDADPAWVARVRAGLRSWYAHHRRDLPWRRDRDPYRVLVSEAMLVQTTVAAVVPYFERFTARFPTVAALAAADEAEVLKAWEGLGYYRRARQLHEAARRIVADHGGAVPDDPAALRALPGVGRYMAGAVASIAFDRPEPIVEANTKRVLARMIACRGPIDAPPTMERLWLAAARLVDPEAPGTFNQALMELGATLCTPRAPRCLLCPASADCRARAEGSQESIPLVPPRQAPQSVVEACAVAHDPSGRLLLVRRAPGGLWSGFWELPTVHLEGPNPAGRPSALEADLGDAFHALTDLRLKIGSLQHTIRYGVTRYRVELRAHPAESPPADPRPGPGLDAAAWLGPDQMSDLSFGAATRKLLAAIVGMKEK